MDAETAVSIFFGALLAVFSVAMVGYTFLRGQQSPAATVNNISPESTPPEGDNPALGDIFDAIRTLELEYQLGRMPQEDFQAQFQAYRVQAATVLRDQLEAGHGDPAWILEQEISLLRDAQEGVGESSCPDCSAAVPRGVSNCPHCGAELALQP